MTPDEVIILDEVRECVLSYLRPEGRAVIEESGTSVVDIEGDMVTPLVGNDECAYTILEGNIFMCAIERAWSEGKISFRKPISCHLFPVRIKKYSGFNAVNFEEWSICFSGRDKGKDKGIYAYEFLKEPLIRALGEDVYNQICIAAEEFRKDK